MKIRLIHMLATAALVSSAASGALAGTQIRAVGSSTVYPFVTATAEEFGRTARFKTPIVESTGTGGGFKLFCSDATEGSADIANASRAIKDSEKTLCQSNSVGDITEIKIGFDGIVLANAKTAPHLTITRQHLFLALARKVPQNGKLVDNPYQQWKEIDPSLPGSKIEVYGPPPTSGTRDAFDEMVMGKTCETLPEFKAAYPVADDLKKSCQLLREDGHYIEAGENDNLIVQKLRSNASAFGIFGYSFLEQNEANIQGATIDSTDPTFENIADGKYPISRPLFVYVKDSHFKTTEGLKDFVRELISDKAIGLDGYLTYKGLVPLKDADRVEVQKTVSAKIQ